MKRFFSIPIYFIVIVCIPLLLMTSTIRWEVGSIKLYEYGFDKYEINQVTGINDSDLTRVAQQLVGYFNLKEETVQVEVQKDGNAFDIYNERELIHLEDVQGLMYFNRLLQWIVFGLILVCSTILILWHKDRWFAWLKGLLWGSIATLGIMAVLLLSAVFGFDQIFLLFHLISFTNDFWILDPATDYLIMMFPSGFFFDAAVFWFGAVLIEAAVIGILAFSLLRIKARQRKDANQS